MRVCVWQGERACMCVCARARVRVCAREREHVCVCVHARAHTHARTHVRPREHTRHNVDTRTVNLTRSERVCVCMFAESGRQTFQEYLTTTVATVASATSVALLTYPGVYGASERERKTERPKDSTRDDDGDRLSGCMYPYDLRADIYALMRSSFKGYLYGFSAYMEATFHVVYAHV